jgi:hypothetical protein
MIGLLRKLFFEDFWLKLFSLALGVLIWLNVSFASRRELGTEKRVLPNLPVRVVASAEDVHNFRVNPSQVEITVQGDPYLIRNLQSEDVRALVDLTGVATARDLHKPIRVYAPPGVTCIRITPEEAQIIFPPER